jgi:hypothetical protein
MESKNGQLYTMPTDREIRDLFDKAAGIIGSDFRNIGVVIAALDWQSSKIEELAVKIVLDDWPTSAKPGNGDDNAIRK